ncbi:hypothetical protein LPJ56_002058, partial [Coemansia sp. RSA 2599]
LVDFDMLAGDWVYHGEGNANILFAYAGSHPQMQNHLLRLVKSDDVSPASSSVSAEPSSAAVAIPEKDMQKSLAEFCENLLFTKKVIGSLLGDAYILPQRLVRVTAPFVESLNAAAKQLRPAHRTHKRADSSQVFGVIIADMAGRGSKADSCQTNDDPSAKDSNVICIEIKPKWGHLPKSSYISEETSVKRRVCRYCMKQYLKHGADSASRFCPLDLYSGDRERMGHALDCLCSSPQNNLHIFVDGTIVGSAKGSSLDTDKVPGWALLKQTVVDILLSDGILQRLARLQSELDHLDIEGLYPRYKRAIENGQLDGSQPKLKDWLSACSAFKARLLADESSSASSVLDIDDVQAVLEFMFSVTLKDISILIQVNPWPSPASVTRDGCSNSSSSGASNGCHLPNYKIVVIDTDPKKLAKIPTYLEQDREIVENYLKHNLDPLDQRTCTE